MTPTTGFFVIAHNIRSLHNVGSIFRTSDVFAVDKLFLSGYTGHPPDPRLEKVSLGADKTVLWEYTKSARVIVRRLRLQYPTLQVVGLENNLKGVGEASKVYKLEAYKPITPILLVLGEEVKGISKPLQKLCDGFVEIPQYGQKESLNLSVAFGIAVYHIKNAIK